jgi:signal transduction histidine kinase
MEHKTYRQSYKTPEDAMKAWRKDLTKKRTPHEAVLEKIEKYLSWFIPIVSSMFLVVIGAALNFDAETLSGSERFIFSAALLLFAALVAAVLSRFESFRYRKWRDDLNIQAQDWAADMIGFMIRYAKEIAPTWEEHDEVQKLDVTETSKRAKESKWLSEEAEHIFDRMLGIMDVFLSKRQQRKLKEAKPAEERERIARAAMTPMMKAMKLQAGPGKKAVILFYTAHICFLLAMLTCLVLLWEMLFA